MRTVTEVSKERINIQEQLVEKALHTSIKDLQVNIGRLKSKNEASQYGYCLRDRCGCCN